MNIRIAGQDCTEALKPQMDAETARMAALGECVFLPLSISALRLREQKTEEQYLDALTDLVRRRNHIDTRGFLIPRRPGLVGALMQRVRKLLWQLLRYQHERMAYRQNLVNSHLIAVIEQQGVELVKLRRQLDELKSSSKDAP